MRISDWSSDVCSSDLPQATAVIGVDDEPSRAIAASLGGGHAVKRVAVGRSVETGVFAADGVLDRKSVVLGKRVSVRVDLGGRRIIKKQKSAITNAPNLNLKPETQPSLSLYTHQ